MSRKTKSQVQVILVGILVTASLTYAGDLSIPHKFVADTPARAAEVNANFEAMKSAIDDNQRQIVELRARITDGPCGAGAIRSGTTCIETAVRPATDWLKARQTCESAGAALCPASTLLSACSSKRIQLLYAVNGPEWTSDLVFWERFQNGEKAYWGGAVAAVSALNPCDVMPLISPTTTEQVRASQMPYRCCFNP